MFDERTFVTQKQTQWQNLSVLLERIKMGGLAAIRPDELSRLGSLYRRTASDLSYVRTQHATPELVFYLNELVGQGHGVLYQQAGGRSVMLTLANFFAWELPDVLRRRTAFVFAAFLISVVGALLAYAVVRENPSNINLFMEPGMKDSFDAWRHGFADQGTVSAGEGAVFAASLMTHNTGVSVGSFATGITTILPAWFMFMNGTMIGALVAYVQPTGHSVTMWAGLLPHGVCELSGMFIDGGAGLLTGWALIAPGRYSRKDALVANAKDAVKMALGTIPLFIIAGTLEANVSHAALPHFVKFTLAGVQFAALLIYIYGGWTRKPLLAEETGPAVSGAMVVKRSLAAR